MQDIAQLSQEIDDQVQHGTEVHKKEVHNTDAPLPQFFSHTHYRHNVLESGCT